MVEVIPQIHILMYAKSVNKNRPGQVKYQIKMVCIISFLITKQLLRIKFFKIFCSSVFSGRKKLCL